LVHDRLVLVVVPGFLGLLARGLVASGSALRGRPLRTGEALVAFLPLAAASVFGLCASSHFAYASEPVAEKAAGLWLREHFPQTTRLLIFSPAFAFYFYDGEHQANGIYGPWAEYPALLSFARQKNVDVIAVPVWRLRAWGFPTRARG